MNTSGSPKRAQRRFGWLYLGLVAVSLLWLLLQQTGSLRSLENLTVDSRFRARGPIDAPLRVVYVDIDTEALTDLGAFPWDRSIFSRISEGLLTHGGARAVGIDVVFSNTGIPNIADRERHTRGHAEFGRYLFQKPPVVLAASYASGWKPGPDGKMIPRELPLVRGPSSLEDPPELPEWTQGPFTLTPPHVGLIDTLRGEVREIPVFAPVPGRVYRHISLELARLHWGVPEDAVRIETDHAVVLAADGAELSRIPLRDGQFTSINWFSPWLDDERNPRVSLAQVYAALDALASSDPELSAAGREYFTDEFFKDAVVLIGPVDNLFQDLAVTPFDAVPAPKVGVHGNMLKTIVSGRFLHTPAAWALPALTIGLTALVAGLFVATEGRRSAVLRSLALVALVGYVALAYWLFARADIVLPLIAPVGSALSAAFAGVAIQLIIAQRQKNRIKGLFGAYLAPSVVSQMVDAGQEPTLGGVEEEITAYFSDIVSFSSFSEVLPPARLVELMNEYLTACTDIVQAEGGTLDKYIGDAVVAMYGAPLALPPHAHRACIAALRVQRRGAELREKWRRETERPWPELVHRLRTRIGLNTGRAVVGNMGSESRFSYTMMGDTVNLAARMESGAKAWGAFTMCTEATRAACEALDESRRVVFRRLGKVVVKGRSTGVPIHELYGLREDLSDRDLDCIARFEQGLTCFYARDWEGAQTAFQASATLEANQLDKSAGISSNPSQVYLQLLPAYRARPPGPDWDGSHIMTEK